MGVLTRVLRSLGGEETLDRLSALPGSDLNSVLLALTRRRAGALSGPDVLRQYRSDRFVAPAQLFSGAGRFAHFTLFAAVSAGRDRGSLSFERQHFAEHIAFLREACGDVEVRVTVLDPRFEVVRGDLPADPSRHTGYYQGLCFKVFRDGMEIGDGGFVDWTRRLTGNRKERLLISGVGVDRFATL